MEEEIEGQKILIFPKWQEKESKVFGPLSRES